MAVHNDCNAYVNYLLAEHRRLHRMLRVARQEMARDWDNHGEWAGRITKVLRDLRSELQCHFTQEEEGGCLDQAVSFHPQLSPQMKHIEEEHPHLLASIDRLVAQAQDCSSAPAERLSLATEFDEFCRGLHAHEAAENELLRQGFGADMDSEENGVTPPPLAQCAVTHKGAPP